MKTKIIYEKSTIDMISMNKSDIDKEFKRLNKAELLILSKKLIATCYFLNNDMINAIEHYNMTQKDEKKMLKPFYK